MQSRKKNPVVKKRTKIKKIVCCKPEDNLDMIFAKRGLNGIFILAKSSAIPIIYLQLQIGNCSVFFFVVCGIPFSRHFKQTRDSSFYHPRPPNCPSQMLTARALSQHLVSKTIRPDIWWGARCERPCEMMWSAIISVPHSQFEKGTIFRLLHDEQQRPTPECRQLSLIQDALKLWC